MSTVTSPEKMSLEGEGEGCGWVGVCVRICAHVIHGCMFLSIRDYIHMLI